MTSGLDEDFCFPMYVNSISNFMTYINLKAKQLQHETDAWKRTLEFLLQENFFLKTRLAELLRSENTNDNNLSAGEHYQTRFLQKDEAIRLMRKEIAELDGLMLAKISVEDTMPNLTLQKLKRVRKEIQLLEATFNILKNQFNNYLAESE
jgi:hypothetical protein